MSDLRLSERDMEAIKRAATLTADAFGFKWLEIALFGSRTNPNLRGGDIDLYIQTIPLDQTKRYEIRSRLQREICDKLGEQKIDVILDDGTKGLGAFEKVIQDTKVILWTQTP